MMLEMKTMWTDGIVCNSEDEEFGNGLDYDNVDDNDEDDDIDDDEYYVIHNDTDEYVQDVHKTRNII